MSEAADAIPAATGVAAPVVIGWSFRSLAAALATSRGFSAVWLTPVLTDQPALAALRQATARACDALKSPVPSTQSLSLLFNPVGDVALNEPVRGPGRH